MFEKEGLKVVTHDFQGGSTFAARRWSAAAPTWWSAPTSTQSSTRAKGANIKAVGLMNGGSA